MISSTTFPGVSVNTTSNSLSDPIFFNRSNPLPYLAASLIADTILRYRNVIVRSSGMGVSMKHFSTKARLVRFALSMVGDLIRASVAAVAQTSFLKLTSFCVALPLSYIFGGGSRSYEDRILQAGVWGIYLGTLWPYVSLGPRLLSNPTYFVQIPISILSSYLVGVGVHYSPLFSSNAPSWQEAGYTMSPWNMFLSLMALNTLIANTLRVVKGV
jgi:hypothetical protein